MPQVVQQFLEEPGVRRVADALVPDQQLRLMGDFRPRQVPQGHLVLAPLVDLDLDERAAFQRDVVRQGDHGLVATARGDVHVRLDLLGLERAAVGLRLDQCRPQLAGPFDPDHSVGATGVSPCGRVTSVKVSMRPAGAPKAAVSLLPNSGT